MTRDPSKDATSTRDPGWSLELFQAAVDLSLAPTLLVSLPTGEVVWANRAADAFAANWTASAQDEIRQYEPDAGGPITLMSRDGRREEFAIRRLETTLVLVGQGRHGLAAATQAGPLDSLTGLGSRVALEACLETLIKTGIPNWGILFLDLDNYKLINDRLGHLVGDQVLVQFAKRLSSCARPSDAVFRFGGDEFVIVVREIPSEDVLHKVAGRIRRDAIVEVPEVSKLPVTATVGCAIAWATLTDSTQIIDRADRDMYRSKKRQRGD